ncbi:P-loop containing nucleoside triphosphate hydrolase protein [Trichoderma sp. SZMC 28014]
MFTLKCVKATEATKQIANNQFGDGATIIQGHINTTLNLNLTHRPARAAIRLIPYPRNEDLIHRPDLVDELNKLLPCSSATSQSAALWGLGGSGKTQIALNYAYQRSDDASCSVLWVHADTEATFSQDYKSIARKLRINKSNLSNEDLLRAVRDGIEALPKWVLVVDNADDLKLFGVGQTAEETTTLFQYIPQASTGTVLWTTRDAHITGTLVGQGQGIEVASMEFNEAKQLLMTFGSEESSTAEAEIDSLVKELQLLPLAIMQAGVYMQRTSTTPKEYSSLLAQNKKRWRTLKTNEFNRHRRPSVPNNVLETWSISITRIRQESENAYNILHVIAYVSNENIPQEIITTALAHLDNCLKDDPEELESEAIKIITRLKEFSFIGIRKADGDGRNYEMHKLVQEAIRYGLSMRNASIINKDETIPSNVSRKGTEVQTSRHRQPIELTGTSNDEHTGSEKYFSSIALQAIADLFPDSQQNTWRQCEKLLAHVLQIGEWGDVNEKQIETANLLYKASIFLYARWRWRESERVDERVLHYTQKMLGDRHPSTIQAMACLAMTYHKQGRYSKAERLEVQVLDSRREILGDRHPDTIQAIANLASTYNIQGRYSESEPLNLQVLDSQREILGDRHPDTIQAIANLASAYHGQGRYSEAERLEVQVRDSRREILGDRHPNTILSMNNLAWSWYEMSRHEDATKLMQQALEYGRSTLGPDHPQTKDSAEALQYFASNPTW